MSIVILQGTGSSVACFPTRNYVTIQIINMKLLPRNVLAVDHETCQPGLVKYPAGPSEKDQEFLQNVETDKNKPMS